MKAEPPSYFLPVSPEKRASWLPQVPKDLTNSSSDYVSYQATDLKGRKTKEQAAACYSYLRRSSLSEYHIHCRPKQKPKALSLEDAQTFFSIMAQHRIIPEKVRLWEEENGVHCEIPAQAGPAPNIYAALTCYRWVDAHPPLVWGFLRILEQDVPRHPLQILPYLISCNVRNCNHSFITTKGWDPQLKEYEKATNPTLGLAAKIFFDREDPRGEEAFAQAGAYCNTTISKISREISPRTLVELNSKWGPGQSGAPQYHLQRAEDGLHPDLYPLYTLPNITTEQIQEIFSKLFTKKGA